MVSGGALAPTQSTGAAALLRSLLQKSVLQAEVGQELAALLQSLHPDHDLSSVLDGALRDIASEFSYRAVQLLVAMLSLRVNPASDINPQLTAEFVSWFNRKSVPLPSRTYRVVLRHSCESSGCGVDHCILCQHNPSRACKSDRHLRDKYLENDPLRAKCGAAVNIVVIDHMGQSFQEGLENLRLKVDVLNGDMYDSYNGMPLTEDQLQACIVQHEEPLLVVKRGRGTPDAVKLLPFEDELVCLSRLQLTASSEAKFKRKAASFRLLLRVTDSTGRPRTDIPPAVTEGFVVATRRVKNDQKHDIPALGDDVSKLVCIGKATVDKLADLEKAAQSAGVSKKVNVFDIPEDLHKITKVGILKRLVEWGQDRAGFDKMMSQLLKIPKDKWEEAASHARQAVTRDNMPAKWCCPGLDFGLVYSCCNGAVQVRQQVLGIVHLREGPGGQVEELDVVPINQVGHAILDQLDGLRAKAEEHWGHWRGDSRHPHPGWSKCQKGLELLQSEAVVQVTPATSHYGQQLPYSAPNTGPPSPHAYRTAVASIINWAVPATKQLEMENPRHAPLRARSPLPAAEVCQDGSVVGSRQVGSPVAQGASVGYGAQVSLPGVSTAGACLPITPLTNLRLPSQTPPVNAPRAPLLLSWTTPFPNGFDMFGSNTAHTPTLVEAFATSQQPQGLNSGVKRRREEDESALTEPEGRGTPPVPRGQGHAEAAAEVQPAAPPLESGFSDPSVQEEMAVLLWGEPEQESGRQRPHVEVTVEPSCTLIYSDLEKFMRSLNSWPPQMEGGSCSQFGLPGMSFLATAMANGSGDRPTGLEGRGGKQDGAELDGANTEVVAGCGNDIGMGDGSYGVLTWPGSGGNSFLIQLPPGVSRSAVMPSMWPLSYSLGGACLQSLPGVGLPSWQTGSVAVLGQEPFGQMGVGQPFVVPGASS